MTNASGFWKKNLFSVMKVLRHYKVKCFFFSGSLILFDILSNQNDLNLSKSAGPFAVANGVVKQPHFQEKQV